MNDQRDARPEGADLRDRFAEAAPVILVDPEPVARRARHRRAMTRALTGVGAVVAVLAVVLLVRPDGDAWTGPPAGEPPAPEPARPVSIEVVPGVVEPGDVITAVLVAHEANNLTFGVGGELERWDGRAWRRAGAVHLCLVEWECVGQVLDRLDGTEDIGLSAAPGTPGPATVLSTDGLTDGWYRLVQRAALDKGLASGAFEVRSDAPAAAPQPAPDDVRLAVTPALVPPAGGLVDVVTLVPAGRDGTLTSEDIEAVDETLAPSALLQRWADERWEDVGDLPVGEPAEEGVEWGSRVALPALQEGSYRLVRERPGEDPVWGVFTVVAEAPPLEQPDPPERREASVPPPSADDVLGPDHPMCQEQPGRCLLDAWWSDVVAEAGVERGGGDHDVGFVLTDTVEYAGRRALLLTLFPAEAPPARTDELVVETTTQVGETRVEAGRWGDGAAGRRLTCGGLVLEIMPMHPASHTAGEIDDLVSRLTAAMTDCPTDAAALAARYPEMPPVP